LDIVISTINLGMWFLFMQIVNLNPFFITDHWNIQGYEY
jgi:hypothetical protein